MRVSSVFERVFSRIYGKPCWQARPGHGTFLTFEFGRPHLDIREPVAATKRATTRVRARLARRSVEIHGDWHLWIYCCEWEVFSRGKRVGDSSRKATARRAVKYLVTMQSQTASPVPDKCPVCGSTDIQRRPPPKLLARSDRLNLVFRCNKGHTFFLPAPGDPSQSRK